MNQRNNPLCLSFATQCPFSCIHAGFVLQCIIEISMYPLTWSAGKTGTFNIASISNVFKGSMSIVSCHLSILVYFSHVIKLAVNQYVSRD